LPKNIKPNPTSPERRNRDLAIPPALADLQRAFGQAIATPFRFDAEGTWRTRRETYPADLVAQMVPCPERDLDGSQRLSTYNEQYWFRLNTTLRQEYPLLERLVGKEGFNRLVSDYLEAFPSRSPTLRDLSNDLAAFLGGRHEWNTTLLREAARLDYLYIQAFDAAACPIFDPATLSAAQQDALSRDRLRFQPHWFLFAEHWPLVRLRECLVAGQEPGPLPPPERRGFWAIHRAGSVAAVRLGPLQYRLLEDLHGGASIEQAVAALAEASDQEDRAFLARNISDWFAHWLALGWFAAADQEPSGAEKGYVGA